MAGIHPLSRIRFPSLSVIRAALIVLGLTLWTISLLHQRPLFIDEANVARNLFARSYAGLFSPLDFEQYAPPFYLVLTKLMGDLLGYSEIPLRIPAILGGVLAVYGLSRSASYLRLGYWSLVPLALLFVNPTVLRYVGEVKPYGVDLGISACLIALHLRPRRIDLRWWAVIGMACPWLSLPSVFVLAAIGLDGVRQRPRWLFPIIGWLASFALLYFTVLRVSVGTGYLNAFHLAYFFPLPDSWAALRQIGDLSFGLLRLTAGFTVVGLVWGGLLLILGAVRLNVSRAWLLLPLLLVVAASSLRQYSLIERLMLFVLPPMWLIIGLAAQNLQQRLGRPARLAFLGFTLIALGGTNIYRSFYAPSSFSDGRRLAELAADEAVVYAHPEAFPVVDYYTRIHPRPVVVNGMIQVGLPHLDTAGEYLILFDVTSQDRIVEAVTNSARRAEARGCRVDRRMLFRSEGLRIRCPGRNSGR